MSNQDKWIGKHRLLKCLHEGRYTDVWLAEHVDLKKTVAIKILFPQEIPGPDEQLRARRRFYREAHTLAQLTHPNIVQVFDYGEERDFSYFVMEYAPYGSLARHHHLGERVPLPRVRIYTSQVGRAIHYIHAQGLIHRDIKPQNMFLKTRNIVLLGDFGLVMRNPNKYYPRVFWELGGTRAYMAPEQQQGKPCPASDQYAFATVVFEWLTGRSPFNGTAEEIAWQREHLSPPSMHAIVPEIPAAIDRVVRTALNAAPAQRFKTMLDFTLAFEGACRPVMVRLPYDASVSRSRRVLVPRQSTPAPRHSRVGQRQPALVVFPLDLA